MNKIEEKLKLAQMHLRFYGLNAGTLDMENQRIVIDEKLSIDKDLCSISSLDMQKSLVHAYDTVLWEFGEFCESFLDAPLLKGLEDKNFRELIRWNKVVLAARITALGGLGFVTWKTYHSPHIYDHGHYFSGNYLAAKYDFALRSGLVKETDKEDE